MAYISTETVANIRKALKDEFGKGVKFSVRKGSSSSSVTVTVMASPLFEDGERASVNHYYIKEHYADQPHQAEFLSKIDEIIRKVGNYWDESDSQVDYFNTAFYYNIEVGQWDKPHTKTSM